MKGKYLEPTIDCQCAEESLATEATKERRYTWLNARGLLVSRKLTAYECRLEDDMEKLQDALFSISSHYAKIQFRLRQIASATDAERSSLLRELERITYQDIDEHRDNNELPTLLNDSHSLGNVRIKQQKIIAQLRGRLRDLVEVSDCCFCAKSEHIQQLRGVHQLQQEPAGAINNNPTPQERGYLSETWPSHTSPDDASFPAKKKSKKKRRKSHKSPARKRYSPDRCSQPSAGKSYAASVATHRESRRGNQDVRRKTQESEYAKNPSRRQIGNRSPKPKRNGENESNRNMNRKTQESNQKMNRKTEESEYANNQNVMSRNPSRECNQDGCRKLQETELRANDQDVPRRNSKDSQDSTADQVVKKRKIRSRIVFESDHYRSAGPSNQYAPESKDPASSSSHLLTRKYSHSPICGDICDDSAQSKTICQQRACRGKCSTSGACVHQYKDKDDLNQYKKVSLKNIQFCERATCSQTTAKEQQLPQGKPDKKDTRQVKLHKATKSPYAGQNNFAECTRSNFLVYPIKYGARNDRCLNFCSNLRQHLARKKRDNCEKNEDSKTRQEQKPGNENTDC